MVGSNALSTVKRDSDNIDKVFKDEMPKDAYAMWNKLNKSLIGYDADACTNCGECISACPVGALVSSDFQYTSNAWELKKYQLQIHTQVIVHLCIMRLNMILLIIIDLIEFIELQMNHITLL